LDEDRRREDDWFRENEQQLLEAARHAREKREKERAAQEVAGERERLKALHYMKCPKCGHDMREESLEEVTVDRCTFCEGIYFDAGELDRVLLKKTDERKGFFRRLVGM
jgi:ribosomal protein L32